MMRKIKKKTIEREGGLTVAVSRVKYKLLMNDQSSRFIRITAQIILKVIREKIQKIILLRCLRYIFPT